MSDRKVFIRSNPLRVVVKPHPGAGQSAGNRSHIETHAEAVAYAGEMAERYGCEVVDETGG